MRILVPKHKYPIQASYGPLFYFGGPVRGGSDWQSTGVDLLKKKAGHDLFHVAIPYYHRSPPGKFPLRDIAEKGNGEPDFKRQLLWERYYMLYAARYGCLMFWVPVENPADRRPPEEGPYAMDTRRELGEWSNYLQFHPEMRVVVGIEDGFPGKDTIKRSFDANTRTDFPIYSSLEETAAAAAA